MKNNNNMCVCLQVRALAPLLQWGWKGGDEWRGDAWTAGLLPYRIFQPGEIKVSEQIELCSWAHINIYACITYIHMCLNVHAHVHSTCSLAPTHTLTTMHPRVGF